ncbi:MAG: GNAT family N-acetyltransferase [Firmicutes bacterium]|nr:GNAT family N-acetyltransferase [Bacillota bacterium]
MNPTYSKLTYMDESIKNEIQQLVLLCQKKEQISFKLELDYKIKDAVEIQKTSTIAQNNEFFCYNGKQLIGYVGISQYGDSYAEVNGLIHPDFRRNHYFSTLLHHVESELLSRGRQKYLLLTDATSISGKEFAQYKKGVIQHTEYEMELPLDVKVDDVHHSVKLLLAKNDDSSIVNHFNEFFSGDIEKTSNSILPEEEYKRGMEIYLAKIDGETIGKIHLQFHGEMAWIYGFIINPEFRGKQYGKNVLLQAITLMRSRGVTTILLQVDSDNPVAFSLYQRIGFKILYAMEYYVIDIKK